MRKMIGTGIFIGVFLYASSLFSGTIKLTSSLTCEVTPPMLKAGLVLTNEGDEAAHNIQVGFEVQGLDWSSNVLPVLEPNTPQTFEHQWELDLDSPGVYPLIARIDYQDAAGYPLSAVAVNPFTYIEATRSDLFGEMESISLTGEKKMNLVLTNSAQMDVDVLIRMVTPRELTIEPEQTQVLIAARSKSSHRFKLSNFSALAGASYPIWAVVEYDRQDRHYNFVSSTVVNIQAPSNLFKDYWWIWIGLALLLISIFLCKNLKKK